MTDAISILLVDDNAEFRQGLRTLLGFYTDGPGTFEVVAEAESVAQAIEMIETYSPMITLLDMELAEGTGVDVLQRLKTLGADTRVLSLSAHREDRWIYEAMQAGAKGYVAKDKLGSQLYDALRAVLKDAVYLDPELASGFFRLFHANPTRPLQAAEAIRLTDRERDVLHWLVQGASNEMIAKQLYITVATVKAHLTAIFEKLKVRSRTQAIVKAIKLGLVQA
ncbi:response regulator containing a -like receiver domain protein and an hth dna-binding domain protein [Leptolyngbya sp. Heron Island J]|uniref:LuxR C-terminal-related transcriptional regulator n=1 Tax=Leptolyngbya sp. Heron Island J TaxID=1385935 RepID=UPI0003B942B9|nr:response regulator transcription factor [Leptolyngbya sp. Heron Island J]ESA33861.1 response regulator containing a -like receiver domain protein and an hth dna-binding domain protein [Leptolyngbya sp. Heron Island J]